MPLLEEIEVQSKCISHNDILQSKDRLFFINYTPQRTLRSWWYLFQVDLAGTPESNPNPKEQGIYYCMILAKHPENQGKIYEISRWWPEWY